MGRDFPTAYFLFTNLISYQIWSNRFEFSRRLCECGMKKNGGLILKNLVLVFLKTKFIEFKKKKIVIKKYF